MKNEQITILIIRNWDCCLVQPSSYRSIIWCLDLKMAEYLASIFGTEKDKYINLYLVLFKPILIPLFF